jgi:hypothetical protein
MADDNQVEIRFVALTGGLVEGIDRAKDAMQSYMPVIADLATQFDQLGNKGKAAMAQLKPDASDRDAARAAMEGARAEIRAADVAYQSQMQKLNAELAMHQITEDEKTAATLAAIDDRERAQQLALAKASETNNLTLADWQRLENEETAAEEKADRDRLKAAQQAQLKYAQEWKSAADQVASAFDSQLRKLLSGHETWAQAMKQISADLVLKLIENQVKATAEFLAEKAREVAATLAGESAKTGATEAGAALRSAAEVTSGQTSILQVIANALKAIFAGAGQTAAGVSAAVAPEAGPAAPAIGLAAGGAVAAGATALFGIASADVGTNYVVRGGLINIHQGETIIPAAKTSGPYTGTGGTVHAPVSVNISALDSRSIERFFNDNAKHMIRAINNGVKNGAHLALRGART